jgi:hypothetical protein
VSSPTSSPVRTQQNNGDDSSDGSNDGNDSNDGNSNDGGGGGSGTLPGGACFHGDGTVLLESGLSKRLSDLKVGDKIISSDGLDHFSFSPVTVLPHAKNLEPAAFLNLTTETGKSVEMTSDHFIPKCDQEIVMASELVVGDCLLTVDGKETITEVSSSVKPGVYTAITKDKFIVVNGIVASPFSKNSDLVHPQKEIEKYELELERERQRKLAYLTRKAAAAKGKPLA